MSTLVEIKSLSYRYPGAVEDAIRDISFTVEKGDVVVLTGPNGSGKSTILGIINGSMKNQSGLINVHGKTAYASQKILPVKSIPLRVRDVLVNSGKNNIRKDIYEILGVDKILEKQLIDLSGGELQKVNLCNAIRYGYDIILLDEPEQNLDFTSQKAFYDIMQMISHEYTWIIVSHDIHKFAEVLPNARVLCINKVLHCGDDFIAVHHAHYNHNCNIS